MANEITASALENRIVRFTQLPTGARCLGVTVNGVKVLLTPSDGAQQKAADALALAIANLGPECDPTVEVLQPIEPTPKAPGVRPREAFTVGQRVWCKVHGAEGWCTVVQVGTDRNRGRIKISSERCWCPAGNFSSEGP